MGFDRHDFGIGPIVVGHDSEASHVRTDIDDRSDVMGTKVVDSVLVMKYAVGELNTLGLDVEVVPVDLVANRGRHG